MISGTLKALRPLPVLLATAILAMASAQAETLDVPALVARLAKPAPASIDFTEVRFSPLLKQPAIVAGVLGYEGPEALDRQVVRPYRERTEIRGTAVRVHREGEPERNFALQRAPELQGLLSAFTSLLAGNHDAVADSFAIAGSGTDEKWQLALTPKNARLGKRVRQIRIDGRNDLPHCFWIENDNGGASVMLLGSATHIELQQPLTREWLERKCEA